MLEIREEKLKDMLFRRKKHIKTNGAFIEALLCFISFAITVILADIKNSPLNVQIGLIIAGIAYIVIFVLSIYGSNYSVESFYEDICSVAEKEHNFSLVLLRDTSGLFPSHYLLNYEKRWGCYLFPFVRTNKENDLKSVENYISSFIGIKDFKIKKVGESDFTKYSVSANLQKTYHHTFYIADFDAKNTIGKKQTIKLNHQKYKWLSIPSMKANKKIWSRNNDNIRYVEEHFSYIE